MNLSRRSRLSLCQFLDLFDRDSLVVLFDKYGLRTDDLSNQWDGISVTAAVRKAILAASGEQIGNVLGEALRTHGALRYQISPRYRFDERWNDLLLCLELDGYRRGHDEYERETDTFVPTEPAIEGVQAVEDDLAAELRRSGLSEADEIARVVDNSADSFRRGDSNACLGSARVALETLATSIARSRQASHPESFDSERWGQVISYLRTSGFITEKEERGLAGVYGFISPGAHIPIGFTEQELARLGRSMALSFCYFLVKRFNGEPT